MVALWKRLSNIKLCMIWPFKDSREDLQMAESLWKWACGRETETCRNGCQYQHSVNGDWRRLLFIHSKLVDDLHTTRMSIQLILTNKIGINRVCLRWVPHFIRFEEMEHCRSPYTENLTWSSEDPDFLSRVITVDESGILNYNSKKVCQQMSGGQVK